MGVGDKAVSLTTISTPHNGSKTVDLLMRFPDIMVKIAGKLTDIVFRLCGNKKLNSYKVFHALITQKASEFNEEMPNIEGVYYQSYAFVMKNSFSDLWK